MEIICGIFIGLVLGLIVGWIDIRSKVDLIHDKEIINKSLTDHIKLLEDKLTAFEAVAATAKPAKNSYWRKSKQKKAETGINLATKPATKTQR